MVGLNFLAHARARAMCIAVGSGAAAALAASSTGILGCCGPAPTRGGLSKRVNEEVRRYLACGDVRQGLRARSVRGAQGVDVGGVLVQDARVVSLLGARRAHQTAAHLGEILPRVPYRQWTLSLPRAFRWLVLQRPKLLREVERRLVRAVWR